MLMAGAVGVATVHLRVCGERVCLAAARAAGCGSSPRVRRAHLYSMPQMRARRFISACAENACFLNGQEVVGSVHLRVCGERPSPHIAATRPGGSSPRVRRTPRSIVIVMLYPRFISACAENAEMRMFQPALPPVHLRVCGERGHNPIMVLAKRGSSPRVRRTLLTPNKNNRVRRFISACAENAGSI